MATPVFVVGKQRSGTTWLANQLCEHPQIAGVRHEAHLGIHESVFFSYIYGRYGCLRDRSNFIEFAEVMLASDYFRIAGITREFLYALWPTTYVDVFRAVHEYVAEQQGCPFWLEKSPTHAVWINELAAWYPDAKFVGVTRDLPAVVASDIRRFPDEHPDQAARCRSWRKRVILRTCFGREYYNKMIRAFARRHPDRILVVRYADMRADLEAVCRRICDFLGLEFDPRMLGQSFPPNTSFAEGRRREVLTAGEKALVRAAGAVAAVVPRAVLSLADSRRWYRWPHRRPLPPWFFRLTRLPADGVEASAGR